MEFVTYILMRDRAHIKRLCSRLSSVGNLRPQGHMWPWEVCSQLKGCTWGQRATHGLKVAASPPLLYSITGMVSGTRGPFIVRSCTEAMIILTELPFPEQEVTSRGQGRYQDAQSWLGYLHACTHFSGFPGFPEVSISMLLNCHKLPVLRPILFECSSQERKHCLLIWPNASMTHSLNLRTTRNWKELIMMMAISIPKSVHRQEQWARSSTMSFNGHKWGIMWVCLPSTMPGM